MEFDVAIIGCGPVGALAANLLGRRGIRTLVVEQAASPHPLPRAVHIDHEMVRIFQYIGLTGTILPLMRDTDGHLHVGADGGVIRYMGTGGQARPFGWSNDYFFYQPELEDALRAGLSRFAHVQLRLGCRLTRLEQAGGQVVLTLQEGEVESRVTVRHAIACDGASSPLRKLLGVRLDDLGFEEPWLVVDAEVDGPLSFPSIAGLPPQADLQRLSVMMCDPSRPATIVPGPRNLRRWEFMLLPGEDDREMMRPERVAGLLAPWVRGVPHSIVRGATYRFHGLVAERWRVGNVFLAGDAAHQTPPFFGQGMCHGFRDVANLAWKLDMVLKGQAPDALLDTYQPEREPHVRSVIGAAVAAGRYICVLDRDKAAERDRTIRAQMAGGPPRTAADLIPAIAAGIVRPGAGQRFIQPRDGDGRLLDDITGGGWRLILRADACMPALPVLWRVVGGTVWQVGQDGLSDPEGQLSRWFDANGAAAVLLRPDFYIYGIATDAGGITGLAWDLVRDLVGGVPAARAA
ncbi:bifunctional 3-(3-hydroxy-phenyl)propionate/3-hydroxycinnamic acid hydroxylase [Niveispirillum sp. KHB5.9]|uniref:bifunctional 3-(3-hydroxy-phenyl)propionate/3-hydroxycinnamic acid hydroxylase MhpA n=1 Tax=Niveispirillum sp. KHB5.9 TaxID=3400269 RepID=UPI003A8B3C92